MPDTADDIEKTGPVLLLENRRRALIGWLAEGEAKIADAHAAIKAGKEQAIEMLREVSEIEAALNILIAAAPAEK